MRRVGFSLIEIMVVILIIGVLAVVLIPYLSGWIEKSKWTEANAMAGTIKNAVKAYFVESGIRITGSLGDNTIQTTLGFATSDLKGIYFIPSDYVIDSVDDNGNAQITVTSSQSNAPKGNRVLKTDGTWEETE